MSLRSVRNAIAQSYPSPLARFSPPPWHPRRAEVVVVGVMLVAAVGVVPAAAGVAEAGAVRAVGLGAEAVPAVAVVPAMGRAGAVAVDGVTIIAAMAGA